MYVRINQVKFPNKMSKDAVDSHAQNLFDDFGKSGRLMRMIIDVSEISHVALSVWKDKESFKKNGYDEISKFSQRLKEMGAIISSSEGNARLELSDLFDVKNFIKSNNK